jgi:hypothetical protein
MINKKTDSKCPGSICPDSTCPGFKTSRITLVHLSKLDFVSLLLIKFVKLDVLNPQDVLYPRRLVTRRFESGSLNLDVLFSVTLI